MSVFIRPIAAEDRAAWGALWRGYLDYYETELPDAVYDSSFARMLSGDAGEFQGRLALWNGRPVGLVHFLFHRSGWKIENVCYLQDLFTLPEMRGKGIARALIERVYAEADAADAPAVYWMTQNFNTTARRLYDKIATQTPFIEYER